MSSLPRHIFLASLGNPAPYSTTLHSAGHIVLGALATHLRLPPFHASQSIRPGLSSTISLSNQSTNLTLWKSPSAMNISGPTLKKAWSSYLRTLPAQTQAQTQTQTQQAELFLIHDELELRLGQVRLKQSGSAKGHNGIRSILASFQGSGITIRRIGVGIGRPASRERGDVIGYVLREVEGSREMSVLRGDGVVDEVCAVLGIERSELSD